MDNDTESNIKEIPSNNLKCLKIQVNSHRTEFLYYQKYPKKNSKEFPQNYCALIYYFNELLDEKFFYLYLSLMGQIENINFGSFFGHNKNNNSKKEAPKRIKFVIVKYTDEKFLNILLDNKKAQLLINNYVEKKKNFKVDFQYDLMKEGEDNNENEEESEEESDKSEIKKENEKRNEDEFVLVKSNTAKNNFSLKGVSFKIDKPKNKIDEEVEDDSDENSEMIKKQKKKTKFKNKGNEFYWNFQLLDKKRDRNEELKELFKKDKEALKKKKLK